MKNMKKAVAAFMIAAMSLSMVACGSKPAAPAETKAPETKAETEAETEAPAETDAAESDMQYVLDKGTLVVGITDFEPMDYMNADGEWVGFDADVATAFASILGVTVEFVEINWDNKVMELEGKTIDCVWNGMTLTPEVLSAMECSNPYCNNAQVVVVSAKKAADIQSVEDIADLVFAVEAGSAGEEEAIANELEYTAVETQSNALMEVAAGTSDAAIIDALMAAAMVGEGTSYPDMCYTIALNSEEYGVGFRKGSDLAAELNEFFAKNYETMKTVAEAYGVSAALIEQ